MISSSIKIALNSVYGRMGIPNNKNISYNEKQTTTCDILSAENKIISRQITGSLYAEHNLINEFHACDKIEMDYEYHDSEITCIRGPFDDGFDDFDPDEVTYEFYYSDYSHLRQINSSKDDKSIYDKLIINETNIKIMLDKVRHMTENLYFNFY